MFWAYVSESTVPVCSRGLGGVTWDPSLALTPGQGFGPFKPMREKHFEKGIVAQAKKDRKNHTRIPK